MALADEQSGMLQHPQVLRDGRQGHVEGLGHFADGRLAAGQPLENGAAGGIRQGLEGPVQGRLIVNHMVKYLAAAGGCQAGTSGGLLVRGDDEIGGRALEESLDVLDRAEQAVADHLGGLARVVG